MQLKPQDHGAGRGLSHHAALAPQITDEKTKQREVNDLPKVTLASEDLLVHRAIFYKREGNNGRASLAIIFGLEAASQGQTNRKGMGPGSCVSSAPLYEKMAVLLTIISGLLRGFVSDFEKSWELWALG